MKWWASKTIWGAALGAASLVVAEPKDVQAWAQAAGLVIGAIGVRQAISKNGAGK